MESTQQGGSHLFTVRLWAEEVSAGQIEWRGKVQHVLSGDVRYVRDWSTLVTLLVAMIPDVTDDDRSAE